MSSRSACATATGRSCSCAASIENAAGERRTLPALRAVLADDSGTELRRWRVAALLRVLPAGETTTFEGWLANPPAGAARLSVDFVAADGE